MNNDWLIASYRFHLSEMRSVSIEASCFGGSHLHESIRHADKGPLLDGLLACWKVSAKTTAVRRLCCSSTPSFRGAMAGYARALVPYQCSRDASGTPRYDSSRQMRSGVFLSVGWLVSEEPQPRRCIVHSSCYFGLRHRLPRPAPPRLKTRTHIVPLPPGHANIRRMWRFYRNLG
eukprot:scaffold204212_cov46-Prasinocladus_malaysianus.AAC.1